MDRKRKLKAIQEQIEIYVATLESDELMRTNTFNPTMPDNLLKEKWKDMCFQLNNCFGEPKMTPEEWKRVFFKIFL